MNHRDSSNKVMVLGADGYIGWALTRTLRENNVEVAAYDNFSRRSRVAAIGSRSLTPIDTPQQRRVGWMDTTNYEDLLDKIRRFEPDTVVHLAEQPSAPWSMAGAGNAGKTQVENLLGTLNLIWAVKEVNPDIHIIKLGTMGEYGDWIYDSADLVVPESSRVKVRFDGASSLVEIPTPRYTGSFYHWSKIFDSFNLDFACRVWGLRVTDINQGPVYGVRLDGWKDQLTRFDYDDYFGTVINRFCVQAVKRHPLTVYGKGGQTRGYINLKDSIRAIEIVRSHRPEAGEFRVINQITEVFSINEIAEAIAEIVDVRIEHVHNPRKELEEHFYSPRHDWLRDRGLNRHSTLKGELPSLLVDCEQFADRICDEVLMPRTSWNNEEVLSEDRLLRGSGVV